MWFWCVSASVQQTPSFLRNVFIPAKNCHMNLGGFSQKTISQIHTGMGYFILGDGRNLIDLIQNGKCCFSGALTKALERGDN